MLKSFVLAMVTVAALAGFSSAPAQAYQCNTRHYVSSDRHVVHSPSCKSRNFTAICRDGSYSHSRHHRGTCSRHGGVRREALELRDIAKA